MRKKLLALTILTCMSLQMVACSLEPTCKVSGCEETDIYQDGYCKYHYYETVGENILKDIVN